ncbi:MAG TPA: BTAD domain-containing putative transcriptional regulator [Nitrospirota bacterium]|nr:BTAD domain-containing putative transcriptional regulator [Nitrospirota bacterium]
MTSALRSLRSLRAAQQEANAHLMLAMLYEKKKKNDLVLRHLAEGFSIGQDRGFTYYALLTTGELRDLARKAATAGICTDYCTSLAGDHGTGAGYQLLSVQCLGGFKVFRGGKPVSDGEWKSKRARTLLKLLVAQDGKISRELAADILWPAKGSQNGGSLLNAMLYRLRKTLDPRPLAGRDIFIIRQQGDLLGLNRRRVRTDVGQFLAQAEHVARLRTAHPRKELLKEYEKTLSLYAGDFLPEDLYAGWSAETRDRLRLQYLRTLEEAGTLADSLGEGEKAVALHETLFLADPANEQTCRWLMARYRASGQRTEAIRTYERCERALSRDLDLEPEERTKKLFRSIIGG